MLIMPSHGPVHCMQLPVVAHQHNKYFVEVRDGRLHLRQRNVYVTVEDFASSELSLGGGDDCIRGRVAGATGASAAWSQM
jgi:hypothetical protein